MRILFVIGYYSLSLFLTSYLFLDVEGMLGGTAVKNMEMAKSIRKDLVIQNPETEAFSNPGFNFFGQLAAIDLLKCPTHFHDGE